jgi:predicted amidohydrolase
LFASFFHENEKTSAPRSAGRAAAQGGKTQTSGEGNRREYSIVLPAQEIARLHCGRAGETVYGGSSAIYDPWGSVLAEAGEGEEIISADCDFSIKEQIRNSINVFRDRRPELYQL